MTARILRGFHDVAARPDWLPKLMILNFVAALWVGALALRLLELAHS